MIRVHVYIISVIKEKVVWAHYFKNEDKNKIKKNFFLIHSSLTTHTYPEITIVKALKISFQKWGTLCRGHLILTQGEGKKEQHIKSFDLAQQTAVMFLSRKNNMKVCNLWSVVVLLFILSLVPL